MEHSDQAILSVDVARKALSRLGRHPITLQHAMLEMSLSGVGLSNIDTLAQFANVMHLDISKNSLTSLAVLSNLPTLVELNASSNEITDCLLFGAPLCSFNSAWETGHNSAGSLLTLADLSNNHIENLRDLSDHRFLDRLILHHNRIALIEGLHNLRFLQVLDLSYNSITKIEGLDNLPIRELMLRGNKITELRGLDKLPTLFRLDVAENLIISLSQLSQCTNLTHLDVSNNRIEYIRQCEYVKDIPWLTAFSMAGNPCEQKEHYRLRVLYRLPRLLQFDGTEARLENKVRAFNLYGSPLGDLALREEVLRKYLPQVPFVDHSPQQLPHDEEMDVPQEELLRGLPRRPASAPSEEVAAALVSDVLHGAMEHVLVNA